MNVNRLQCSCGAQQDIAQSCIVSDELVQFVALALGWEYKSKSCPKCAKRKEGDKRQLVKN